MTSPASRTDDRGWRDFAPAAALLLVSSVGVGVAALSPSGDHGQYAVVTPPWYNFALIGTAGGDIVEFGDLANIAIVHSADPGFVRALYRAGAWLVIDPAGLRGCFGFEPNTTRTSATRTLGGV